MDLCPSGEKLALIIANSNYSQRKNQLESAVENARKLNNMLSKIDFNVTLHTNPDKPIMDLITSFNERISNGDLVFFYFCGHGYQINEKNLLIPCNDAQMQTEADVQKFGVNIKTIISQMSTHNHANATIFVFDCSRPYVLNGAQTGNGKLD